MMMIVSMQTNVQVMMGKKVKMDERLKVWT